MEISFPGVGPNYYKPTYMSQKGLFEGVHIISDINKAIIFKNFKI